MKTFEEALEAISKEADEVMVSKQKDYGPKNILDCPVGAELGVVVRLYDKLSRLANLLKSGKTPNNETIYDTYLDIRNYGQILMMVHKKIFGLPLKK